MLTKMKIAIVMAASLVAGVAAAQPVGHGDRGPMVQKFDTNKDGKLDDSERAAMKAAFKAKRDAHKKEMLAQFDTNKDGKLDDGERVVARDTKLTERFKKLDTDGNGQISLGEFKAAKRMKQPRRGGMHHRGRGMGRRGMGRALGTK
jgi:hypothetical protein